jgi:ABC-type sugar transport system ATPase subunit
MSRVLFDHVWKSYANVEVVRDLNLAVEEGEFLVLVGPSGCGKSTTLRMLAGLEEVTRGDIHIGERNVTFAEPRERDIAMVFQSYALYPHMSVEENIGFGLRNRGVPAAEIAKRVNKVSAMLEIGHLLDRRPRNLRAASGNASPWAAQSCGKPVFLMDEPLSNLDAQLRVSMRSGSSSSISESARPPFMSPMTRLKPLRWARASPCSRTGASCRWIPPTISTSDPERVCRDVHRQPGHEHPDGQCRGRGRRSRYSIP